MTLVLRMMKNESFLNNFPPKRRTDGNCHSLSSCRSQKFLNTGSMMSAVKCELCEAGYLLPRLPTVIGDIYIFSSFIFHQLVICSEGSPWRCDGCGKVVGVSLVQSKLKGVLDVIAENRHEDNQSLLKVISLLEKSLHPNHYLILGIKEIIIQRLMQSINASKSKKVLGI